ncbi:MAG: ABC transporter permease [Mycoplasmataceae bacterium]|nr:ABC transporter permease [Mycoplasmataceae bacterium]
MFKITKPKNKLEKVKSSNKFFYSLFAIFIGMLIGIILLTITGQPVLEYIEQLFYRSFGSLSGIGDFIGNLSWILPLGLAMVVSFRVGMFNIGSAGQMLFSGFISYIIAILIGNTLGTFGIVITFFVAIFSGLLVALFIGWLKTKFGINEVISSIMLNWVIFYFVAWGTTNIDFINSGVETLPFHPSFSLGSSMLTDIFGGSTKINWGIIVSIPLVVIIWFIYKFTKFGFKQDILGSNQSVADYIGFSKNKEFLKAMALSGALAGIAAWIYFFGIQNLFPQQRGEINPNLFQGIAVALIGFNTPIGALFSSMFISIFMTSGKYVDSLVSGIPFSFLILATIIIVLAVMQLFIIYRPQDLWFIEDNEELRLKKEKKEREKRRKNQKEEHNILKKQKKELLLKEGEK